MKEMRLTDEEFSLIRILVDNHLPCLEEKIRDIHIRMDNDYDWTPGKEEEGTIKQYEVCKNLSRDLFHIALDDVRR